MKNKLGKIIILIQRYVNLILHKFFEIDFIVVCEGFSTWIPTSMVPLCKAFLSFSGSLKAEYGFSRDDVFSVIANGALLRDAMQ